MISRHVTTSFMATAQVVPGRPLYRGAAVPTAIRRCITWNPTRVVVRLTGMILIGVLPTLQEQSKLQSPRHVSVFRVGM